MISHNGFRLAAIDALQSSKWERELFEEWHKGGLDLVHVTCALWEDARGAIRELGAWYNLVRENSDLIELLQARDDLRGVIDSGRVGVILGFQSTSPIENELDLVEVFHRLGVRVMQLTYNNQTLVGSSCYETEDAGLSRFGREVIKEMNRVGMLIDLSHVGERTSLDAIEASQRPVAVTHANPVSFVQHPRNKSLHVLKAMAERGGVLGVTIYPPLIGGKATSLVDWTEMVARAVDELGVNAVGIGSDASRNWSDGDLRWVRLGRWTRNEALGASVTKSTSWPEWPDWFRTPEDFPRLAKGLSERGLGEEDVAAVLGGNWLRLFEESFEPAT